MYFVDFIKQLFKKNNIPIIIYLVLNVIIVNTVIQSLLPFSTWICDIISIGLYIISLMIALSPVGEFILRFQNKCKGIDREDQRQYLQPIFNEVYARAKRKDHSIPDDIQLYINEDEYPNAFATGRKTICITKGMLRMPPEQIKAVLAHEFGHLAHKDTDIILLISVGNLIVTIMYFFFQVVLTVVYGIFRIICALLSILDGGLTGQLTKFVHFLSNGIMAVLMWLWTKLGVLLVMKSRRENEFEADRFSYELGYGNSLCKFLECGIENKSRNLFACLASSHPKSTDRIGRLIHLGSTYGSGNGSRY